MVREQNNSRQIHVNSKGAMQRIYGNKIKTKISGKKYSNISNSNQLKA